MAYIMSLGRRRPGGQRFHDVYGPAVEAPTKEDELMLAEADRRIERGTKMDEGGRGISR